ncbi:hypothetical protein E2R51_02470 [Jeotgalibacillus sp. S-D1]|uniref:YqhG family protein n=1 Tax=Jeotgalibacillus sp. S-D1 TaxID=2552189 RepID=UPI001059759B|nr:YqhG family protein [Jeotgalibacillus sp. S-D1]TDL34602.1 hypothetical protein E2R51_02470 [Jeotgalibacillus sp. S-D1]
MAKALQWDLVHNFLAYKGVEITKGPSQSLVHLNEELDRKFMNRPFYWHYRDATNQPGDPMTISIIKETTDTMPVNAVVASPLNPIFNQLIDAAHGETRWYKGYETVAAPSTNYAPLYPWVVIQGVLTTDPPGSPSYWKEAAISLTTGNIKTGEEIFHYENLQANLPPQHVLTAPVIQFERAIHKLIGALEQLGTELFKEELASAHSFNEKMNPFLSALLDHANEREYEHLNNLYQPKIRLNHPMGGIIYSQFI